MVADTQTPNAKLNVVAPTRSNWAGAMNDNMKLIDALIGTYFVVNSLRGIWANSTSYAMNDTVVDSLTSVVWQCQVNNISASVPTTFLEDRTNNPTYWSVYSSPARARGAWLPNTAYGLNDFVVSGSQYAICIQTHVSGASFAVDLAAGKWSVLVDLSAAGSLVLPVLGGAPNANNVVVTNAAGTAYIIKSVTDTLTMLGVTTVGKAVFQAASQLAALAAIGAQAAGNYQAASSVLSTLTSNGAPGTFGLALLTAAAITDAITALGLGTAALLDVGTTALKVVQVDAGGKIPAINGSLLNSVIQVVSMSDGAVNSGVTKMFYDDTIPQITEGDQFMEITITPKSPTSLLVIEGICCVSVVTAGADNLILALFRDAVTDALKSFPWTSNSANYIIGIPFRHEMVSGGTAPITFRIRVGSTAAGVNTVTFNGILLGRLFGGTQGSHMIVREYKQ